MKKITLIVCVALAAITTNAANCLWQTTALTADMATTIDAGTYWLVALGAGGAGDSSQFSVYEDGTYDFGSYAVTATGSMTAGGSVGGTLEGLSLSDNGNYYALVIWDGESDGYWGVAEGIVDGIVDAPPTDANPISFDNSGMSMGIMLTNTAVEPIPEPTSGLMLLLGVAGLALRRKQK